MKKHYILLILIFALCNLSYAKTKKIEEPVEVLLKEKITFDKIQSSTTVSEVKEFYKNYSITNETTNSLKYSNLKINDITYTMVYFIFDSNGTISEIHTWISYETDKDTIDKKLLDYYTYSPTMMRYTSPDGGTVAYSRMAGQHCIRYFFESVSKK